MTALLHVLRRMRRTPGFTTIALVTLALGIGANTAIFSVINGVMIKPLLYPGANELVGVWHVAPGLPEISESVNCSPTMLFTYREESHTFRDVGLWTGSDASVTGMGDPEQVRTVDVTYGTLQALGVQPARGRWFSQADDTPGAPSTVILSYGYWQRRFGGDPSAVGRTLMVESRPRTIIGVMPQEFRFLDVKMDLMLPLRFDRSKVVLGNFSYQGLARLKPGVTLQQANADVARMLGIWLNAWPPPPGFSRGLFEHARLGPKIQPLKKEVVGDIGSTLWVLMGTIGLVLLIACANVANLLLVRAEGRQQELAVRAALGADWKRIARELLLESVTLGILGGLLGLGLAFAALRLLVALGPATLPRLNDIAIDPLVLAFTLAVSLLAGLLFGLLPVIKYAGPRLAGTLRSGGRNMSQGRERHRARNILVVVQVGMALVLLIGSGLMIRTFQALRAFRPGFSNPEEVQLLRISIPEAQVKEPERVVRMQNEMIDGLKQIAGVTSVAFASAAPMEGRNPNDVLYAEDKVYGEQVPPLRRFRFTAPGFFQTVGTPLIAGRDFTWTDLYERREVAMVSENMARETWGSPSAALGKHIHEGMKDPWREVVGVVGNVADDGAQQKAPAFAYFPILMDTFWGEKELVARDGVFLVRTKRAATQGFLAEARQAIWHVNANLPIFLVRTLQDLLNKSMARTSFALVMLAIAGAMALLLGVVGIYGVIAYTVSQRMREIGIRIALGAPPSGVRRMCVRHGLILAGIGAGIGLAAAAGLTRLVKTMLFGVAALDPLTYVCVALLLVAAAALASYFPARRATAADPMESLRIE
jgi:putative ABC transport system permease protein